MPRILSCLLLLAALAACSEPAERAERAEGAERVSSAAVSVDVRGVGVDRRTDLPVLLLAETDGERVLPIWIGASEARSIQAEIDSVEWPRPNTHDLAQRLLVGLDATIERVTVTELRDNTYYSVVRVLADRGSREFDARPSDAIAMALRFDAPVYVESALFELHASEDSSESEAVADESTPQIRL